ncbi:MAG: FecR family protein, partial [Bdellovibrionales bacterium]|nr:FecR family protein [Bdellovibrionales bacterium]
MSFEGSNLERDHLRTVMFILPACFVIAFAGLFLWKDYKKTHTTTVSAVDRFTIGKLTRSIKNVKLKREENAYWDETASEEIPLFNRDSIRTGPDSMAFIKMADGSQLVVEENSLIVLETNNERLVVNLSLGDLNIKGESDNLDIKVNNETIRSQKSSIQLGVDEKKKTRIFVKTGEATLLDKDKKALKLETHKVLETNETGKRILNEELVRLMSPLDQTQIISFNGKDKVEFIWEVIDSEI